MALHRFSWVVEDELAAMGAPDGYEADFEELQDRGVGALVSLTMDAVLADGAEEFGFSYLHLPIPDGTAPELFQVRQFMRFCEQNIDQDRPVAVHCLAGIGRTGTMAACYLVYRGMEPHDAISRIRRLRPRSIETLSQEGLIYEYDRSLSNA
ncbi:MAG: dual specificity protein phosphatase family protein [Planctomycetota bacterium]